MATSVTQSLFGITPQSIQNERDTALQQQALQFAKLDPFQAARMGLFQGASQLGTGIAGLMGYEDPEIAQARQRQGMLGGLDLNSPESLLTAAKSIQAQDPMAAQALVAQANELATKQATLRKSKYELEQEQKMREELAALPPDATDADRENILMKYADPEKILGVTAQRATAREAAAARIEAAKQAHADRLELARLNNASRADIAAMNREFQAQMMQMRTDLQKANKPEKTLSSTLQKSEDDDFAAIDTAEGVVADMQPILNDLKEGKLNLAKVNQLKMGVKGFFGSDDPEVLSYQALERNLTRFKNESLRLNKGVQTEGDAQRASAEIDAAFSKNDSKAMQKALEEMEKINKRAAANRRAQINRRRKSQGVAPLEDNSDQGIIDAADAILKGK